MIEVTSIPTTICAGFLPNLVEFSRADIAIVDVQQGTDNTVLAVVNGDITADLEVGDSVYIYSEGIGYTYDITANVTALQVLGGQTLISTDAEFVINGSGGYLNYYQYYFVEAVLTDPEKNDSALLPYTLRDSGTPAGALAVDISAANDLNEQALPLTGGVATGARVKLGVKYRESWRGNNSQAYTDIGSTFIVQFSTEALTDNTIVNDFDIPRYYKGYPAAVAFIRSDVENEKITISIDQLNLNTGNITTGQTIRTFAPGDYGYLFGSTADVSFSFDQNAAYVRVNYNVLPAADYKAGDYSTDYNIE